MKHTAENIESFFSRMRMSPGSDFIRLSIIMTAECNFRCTYCYEDKLNERLNPESAKYFLNKLFHSSSNVEYFGGEGNPFSTTDKRRIQLDFFGGECLLEVKSMDEICQYYIDLCDTIEDENERNYRKNNFEFIVETNGSLLQKKECVDFFKKWRKHFSYVFVTIDGCKEQHDSCRIFKDTKKPTWDIVSKNILWFRKTFPDIMLATKGTICPENVKWLSKSFDAYMDLGFNAVPSTIAVGVKNWDKDSLKILKSEYDKIVQKQLNTDRFKFTWVKLTDDERREDYHIFNVHCMGTCGVNGTAVAITPRDEILACSQFSYLTQNGKSVPIGNVYTGIDEDGHKFLHELQHSYPKKLYTDEHCKICSYKAGCEQCPAMSLKNFGGLSDDEELNCEAIKIERLAAYKYQYLEEKQIWKKIQENENH